MEESIYNKFAHDSVQFSSVCDFIQPFSFAVIYDPLGLKGLKQLIIFQLLHIFIFVGIWTTATIKLIYCGIPLFNIASLQDDTLPFRVTAVGWWCEVPQSGMILRMNSTTFLGFSNQISIGLSRPLLKNCRLRLNSATQSHSKCLEVSISLSQKRHMSVWHRSSFFKWYLAGQCPVSSPISMCSDFFI